MESISRAGYSLWREDVALTKPILHSQLDKRLGHGEEQSNVIKESRIKGLLKEGGEKTVAINMNTFKIKTVQKSDLMISTYIAPHKH